MFEVTSAPVYKLTCSRIGKQYKGLLPVYVGTKSKYDPMVYKRLGLPQRLLDDMFHASKGLRFTHYDRISTIKLVSEIVFYRSWVFTSFIRLKELISEEGFRGAVFVCEHTFPCIKDVFAVWFKSYLDGFGLDPTYREVLSSLVTDEKRVDGRWWLDKEEDEIFYIRVFWHEDEGFMNRICRRPLKQAGNDLVELTKEMLDKGREVLENYALDVICGNV